MPQIKDFPRVTNTAGAEMVVNQDGTVLLPVTVLRTEIRGEIDQVVAQTKDTINREVAQSISNAIGTLSTAQRQALDAALAPIVARLTALEVSNGVVITAQITGTATTRGVTATFTLAYAGLSTVYTVMRRGGFEEGSRVARTSPGPIQHTPQMSGMPYTVAVYDAASGGNKLAETPEFTVAEPAVGVTLPPIVPSNTSPSFATGTAAGTLIFTLSAVPSGATRAMNSDGRIVLNAAKTGVIVGASANSADTTISYIITDTDPNATNSPVVLTGSVAVTAAKSALESLPGTTFIAGTAKAANTYTGDIYTPSDVASGGKITSLRDQVGGLVLAQSDASRAPQLLRASGLWNGRDCLAFNGTSTTANSLNTDDDVVLMQSASTGHTLAFLARVDSPIVPFGYFFHWLDAEDNSSRTATNTPRSWGIANHSDNNSASGPGGWYISFPPALGATSGVTLGNVNYTPDTIGCLALEIQPAVGSALPKARMRWTTSSGSSVSSDFNWPYPFGRPGRITLGHLFNRAAPTEQAFAFKGKGGLYHYSAGTNAVAATDLLLAQVGITAGLATQPTNPTNPTSPTNPSFLPETLDTDPDPTASVNTLPTTFVLENWNTSSSVGMARMGMPFGRGDIPAGKIPAITRDGSPVAAQFDERSYWLDGSLKFCVAHLRDADFPASTSRTYTVNAVTGSYSDTGTKQLSDITTGHDFKVNFASLTETGSTTATVGSGAFTASFNSHSAVATRREKYHSGAVAEGWYAWGMAKDNSGGAEDAHLKANWYVDVWKNADGSIYAYEVAAVLAQDWWSVANKKRRNYNASLNDGATTIETYNSVEHIYKSQWITCQNRGGNHRGKRHWVGGAQPTLTYKPNKTYWRNTKLIAPYDASFTPAAYPTSGNDVYTPCKNQNHRPNIDGTGGYEGRGVNTNPDVVAFMRQDAASAASMRINAHVGLHVYYHMRSNHNRTRPGESADVANTSLPLRMEVGQGPAIPYDFQADGLPAPGHFYADSRADTAHKNGYVDVQGGNGVWSNTTGDSSHASNFSGFAYMLEGERYHLEATMDLASFGVHQGIGNMYMGTPYSMMAGIVSGTGGMWDAIVIQGQQRNAGFATNLIGFATAFAPNNHVAKNYFNRLNRQQGRYLKNALDFMPANYKEVGLHLITDSSEHSPWMTAMSAMGIRQNANITENGYVKLYANHIAKPSIRMAEKHIYRSGLYRSDYMHKLAAWNPSTNPFYKDGTMRGFATVNSTNGTLTVGNDFTQSDCGWDKFTNGDVIYFWNTGDPIKEVLHSNDGTPIYVVNASGNTCQLALTPGGAPLTIPADTHKNGAVFVGIDPQWTDTYTTTQSPPKLYGADSYAAIHRAVVVMANFAGQTEATAAKVQKYNTFLAPVNSSNWVTWKMAT